MRIITSAKLEEKGKGQPHPYGPAPGKRSRPSPGPAPLPSEGGDPLSRAKTRGRRSGSDTYLSCDQVETPSRRRKPGAPHWGQSLSGGGIRGPGAWRRGDAGPAPRPPL